jgi:hypothetical protein
MKSTFFYIDLGNHTLNPTTLSRVTYYISINKMVFRFIARGGKHWVWIGSLMSLVYNYYLLIYNPCSQHSCSTQAIYLGWDLTHRLTHLYFYTHNYIYTYTYKHTHTHTHIYIYIITNMLIYTYIYLHTHTSLMALACVNNIEISSENILDLSLAMYPLYGWLSPRLSFSHDGSSDLPGPKPFSPVAAVHPQEIPLHLFQSIHYLNGNNG